MLKIIKLNLLNILLQPGRLRDRLFKFFKEKFKTCKAPDALMKSFIFLSQSLCIIHIHMSDV